MSPTSRASLDALAAELSACGEARAALQAALQTEKKNLGDMAQLLERECGSLKSERATLHAALHAAEATRQDLEAKVGFFEAAATAVPETTPEAAPDPATAAAPDPATAAAPDPAPAFRRR